MRNFTLLVLGQILKAHIFKLEYLKDKKNFFKRLVKRFFEFNIIITLDCGTFKKITVFDFKLSLTLESCF